VNPDVPIVVDVLSHHLGDVLHNPIQSTT
jgi:hypothetical protein